MLLELAHLVRQLDPLLVADSWQVLLLDKLAVIHLFICQLELVVQFLLQLDFPLGPLALYLLMELALERGLGWLLALVDLVASDQDWRLRRRLRQY